MEINKLQKEIYQVAKSKGFDREIPKDKEKFAEHFLADLALIHSEVSEACEDFRNYATQHECHKKGIRTLSFLPNAKRGGNPCEGYLGYGTIENKDKKFIKPVGVGSELADIIIRTLHIAEKLDIDMERMITCKMNCNKQRPHKHGKTI